MRRRPVLMGPRPRAPAHPFLATKVVQGCREKTDRYRQGHARDSFPERRRLKRRDRAPRKACNARLASSSTVVSQVVSQREQTAKDNSNSESASS